MFLPEYMDQNNDLIYKILMYACWDKQGCGLHGRVKMPTSDVHLTAMPPPLFLYTL